MYWGGDTATRKDISSSATLHTIHRYTSREDGMTYVHRSEKMAYYIYYTPAILSTTWVCQGHVMRTCNIVVSSIIHGMAKVHKVLPTLRYINTPTYLSTYLPRYLTYVISTSHCPDKPREIGTNSPSYF